MRVRRYQAALPKEGPFRAWRDCLELARKQCIARAHAELGAGAVFLNEETRTEERLLGLVRREVVEMLFATDLEGTPLQSQGKPLPAPEKNAASVSSVSATTEPAAIQRLEGEVRDLAVTVRALVREVEAGDFAPLEVAATGSAQVPSAGHNGVPAKRHGGRREPQAGDGAPAQAKHADLRAQLALAEVPEPLLAQLLDRIPEEASSAVARRALCGVLRDTFRTTTFGPPTGQHTQVVALVGPTGVGKTTTIAKLAAPYALERKRRVGMVTLDTYRIAAVEQLRTYGEIMDVPVRVAHGRRDIVQALQSLAHCDLIFLDTAGRSQKNREQVEEMEKVLGAIVCEPHLVLSATSKIGDLHEIVREFSRVRFRSLILTKLDETNTLGPLLDLVAQTGLPISYVTTGQCVPEDIESADPDRLAARLLERL